MVGQRRGNRPQGIARQRIPVAEERFDQQTVPGCIDAERRRRLVERLHQRRGRQIVERMRQRDGRVNPRKPVLLERHRPQCRRAGAERMHRGTEIVAETGKRQLPGTCAAADALGRLVDANAQTGLGKRHGRRQAVRPSSDDDRVDSRWRRHAGKTAIVSRCDGARRTGRATCDVDGPAGAHSHLQPLRGANTDHV